MRVAFLGKGGSGKTSLAASYITHAGRARSHVLAIDADINAHLPDCLGIDPGPWIGEKREEVISYLSGERTDLAESPFVPTTPPSLQSQFIRPVKDDPFLRKYGSPSKNVTLLTVGTFSEKDVGHSCYHGKLNVLEMIYHHLLDDENDLVVADATAGIDNLGTSLYFAYDVNVFVVEPTWKSLKVYLDFLKIAPEYNIPVRLVGNKIMNPQDESFIRDHVASDEILGFVPFSHELRSFAQGTSKNIDGFLKETAELNAKIDEIVNNTQKDWSAYYRKLKETHRRNSQMWWNRYYQASIENQEDGDFAYEKVL